jgi:hypothetical protein
LAVRCPAGHVIARLKSRFAEVDRDRLLVAVISVHIGYVNQCKKLFG